MTKKKIKDLTLWEIKEICKKNFDPKKWSCAGCPLGLNCCKGIHSNCNDYDLEIEIEVK